MESRHERLIENIHHTVEHIVHRINIVTHSKRNQTKHDQNPLSTSRRIRICGAAALTNLSRSRGSGSLFRAPFLLTSISYRSLVKKSIGQKEKFDFLTKIFSKASPLTPCMKHGRILYVPLKGRTAASGSRAMAPHEPRQVRKEAALREIRHVPRGCLEAVARRFKGKQRRPLQSFLQRLLFLSIEKRKDTHHGVHRTLS